MVLSQNRCNVLILILYKIFVVLWATFIILLGLLFPLLIILMFIFRDTAQSVIWAVIVVIVGGSALTATIQEFSIHKWRIDKYFTGEES